MVLSNYIPKNGDYEEALSVKTITKFGKVGGNEEDMPFKKPFICFEKGSIFKGNAADIKGKILEGVHYDKSIVQFGIPYTVEVRVDE
jgi:CRISPR/Cas system CSM-associated protein Csm4 (group 5 of RAMP superfamily)